MVPNIPGWRVVYENDVASHISCTGIPGSEITWFVEDSTWLLYRRADLISSGRGEAELFHALENYHA